MKYKHILYFDNTETVYTRAIRDELSSYAETIDCYFYDEVFQPPIFLKRFRLKEVNQLKNVRIDEFLNSIVKNSYDLILVKEPQIMPVRFFERIRQTFRNVPILNYNWSSIKKYNVLPYIDLFTKIVSFDYADCKKYTFNYLPLFYLKEYESLNLNSDHKKYLLSYIGSGFSEGRNAFLKQLIDMQKDQLNNFYLYIFTPENTKSLKFFIRNKNLARYCYNKPLHFNGVLNVFKQSYSTIDHPMTNQSGLTIRTFEALASGLHLYTTNCNIINEPFYTNERITIIKADLSNFELNTNPIHKHDHEFSTSLQDYRIDNWIRKLLRFIE